MFSFISLLTTNFLNANITLSLPAPEMTRGFLLKKIMDTKSITISLPTIPTAALLNSYKNLKQKIQKTFILFSEALSNTSTITKRGRFQFISKLNPGLKRNKKKMIKSLFPIVLIVLLVAAGVYATRSFTQDSAKASESKKIVVADALKVKAINKTLTFPLIGDDKKEIGTFQFVVDSAEIRDEIVIQGQKANSVDGRTFLIVKMQFKNQLTQGLQINSRDYVRLSMNGNTNELLAPDIHNDPV
jgi:hypothetical protein